MFKVSLKPSKGFTLIELLVVVAIIGILSSVVFSSLNSARIKARDTKKVSDLRQIRLALENYYNENYFYPVIKWATSGSTSYDASSAKWNQLEALLSPYISSLPVDPKSSGSGGPWSNGSYHYAYGSDGKVYDLVAQFEDTSNKYRCGIFQYKYHVGEGSYPAESSWCGSFSSNLYADH